LLLPSIIPFFKIFFAFETDLRVIFSESTARLKSYFCCFDITVLSEIQVLIIVLQGIMPLEFMYCNIDACSEIFTSMDLPPVLKSLSSQDVKLLNGKVKNNTQLLYQQTIRIIFNLIYY